MATKKQSSYHNLRSPPIRRTSPSASKAWKQNLRTACLCRARQQRVDNSSPISPARRLVESEMLQQGVIMYGSDSPEVLMIDRCDELMDYFLSDDDFIELLEEVERELEVAAVRRIDEILKLDEEDFQQRIEDYEAWEEEPYNDQTWCPLCQEARLLNTTDGIRCSNNMNGWCTFALPNFFAMASLRDRLRVAYEKHADGCREKLLFRLDTDCKLIAMCTGCGMEIRL